MILTPVKTEMLDDLWLVVEGWLRRAVKVAKGTWQVEDIKKSIEDGHVVLWMVLEEDTLTPVACFTTRIAQMPRARGLAIDWVGGRRMSEWLPDLSNLLDNYARDNDCSYIEGMGRKGWSRALTMFGYKTEMVFRKEL